MFKSEITAVTNGTTHCKLKHGSKIVFLVQRIELARVS